MFNLGEVNFFLPELLVTLSEIRNVLDTRQIRLTRALGQNFLHDHNVLAKVARAAQLSSDDSVLEVGPGLGALTDFLLRAAARVVAVEKDRRLFDYLVERYAGHSRLDLVHGDALEMLQSQSLRLGPSWRVVSNLPYSVASPILVELTRWPNGPQKLAVTLQLEVAQRVVARAGQPAYGILSVLTQLYYAPGPLFKIS